MFWQSETSTLPVWKSWNLTNLTQKWVNGTATNYGVILWATNEDVNGYDLRFYSSEATNSADRPYLEVIYSTDAATKTVYFLKDHLGSIRATVLDSATAPVIGYDDYDPWGYPLNVAEPKKDSKEVDNFIDSLKLARFPVPKKEEVINSINELIELELSSEEKLNKFVNRFGAINVSIACMITGLKRTRARRLLTETLGFTKLVLDQKHYLYYRKS